MLTTRRWLWVLAGSLAVACGLNPQPDLPGGANGSTSGNSAGGSGVVTPSAGTTNIDLGGSASTAGSGSGGMPNSTAGANAGGDASGGEASGGEASGGNGGAGGEAGENALGAGNHG